MPPVLSKTARNLIVFTAGLSGLAVSIRRHGEKTSVPSAAAKRYVVAPASSRRDKVGVDLKFLRRLKRILAICVPGVFSAEAGFAGAIALFMLARTWCDVWLLRVRTQIEARIVSGDVKGFRTHLMRFVFAVIPVSLVNNLLKYSLVELQLRFRNRLTQRLLKDYLKGKVYYQVSNVDNRIGNPDQLITNDVERFCKSVTDLYSNTSKPILDMIFYSWKLSSSIGIQGPSNMLGYLAVSGVALTWLRKPTGRFTVNEQRLEGEYRFVNSRLITNAEEIAFYNGQDSERTIISAVFGRLMEHVRKAQQFRFSMGFVDSIVAKYFATVVGFWVVSRPFFPHSAPKGSTIIHMTHQKRLEQYYESGRMLLNLAMAVGRLVLAGREMTRLAGFTARVSHLMDVLDQLSGGTYCRTMVGDDAKAAKGAKGNAGTELVRHPIQQGNLIFKDGVIKFENVPLKTPNGDVLVPRLNFQVESGQNVLIAGPNGCGKSSLFRILRGVWPQFGGTITKPKSASLYYIPQRPYLALGTFRDQLIYPATAADMKNMGYTDDDLFALLEQVHLEGLLDRDGGWDAVEDWKDVLSGGEKQRVAMARVMFHKPQFAILDECTSAVSVDVEGFMYTRCRELGITLFTVSHRKSLWKYHEYVLQFDGRGNYEYARISDSTSQYGS